MPSALETLVKILKLEREQGCHNKAVMGGLAAYGETWHKQALPQARRPEHQILTEELTDILRGYDRLENKAERLKKINYMLDRITGRAPIPAPYQARLQTLKEAVQAPAENSTAPSEAAPAQPARRERPPRPPRERPARRETPIDKENRAEPQTETVPAAETPAPRREPRRERRPPVGKNEPNTEQRQPRPPRSERQAQERPEPRTRGERPERLDVVGKSSDAPSTPTKPTRPEREQRPRREEPSRRSMRDDDDAIPAELRHLEDRPARDNQRNRRGKGRDGDTKQSSLPNFATEETFDTTDYYRPAPIVEQDIKPLPTLARPPRRVRPAHTLASAQQAQQTLQQSVTRIKGIGGTLATNLENLGVRTIVDLLEYLPRRYDDYTQMAYIRQLQPETIVTVIGKITHTEVRVGKNNRKDFFMLLDDGSGVLNVTFFGQHFLVRSIRKGMQVVLSGKVTAFRNTLQMSNPDWEQLEEENLHTIGIVPVYRLTAGVPERTLRRSIKQALDSYADQVPDILPPATLERAELADMGWALKQLHFPEGYDHLHHARRRYVFDQLLTLQLGILQNRRDWQSVPGQALDVSDDFLENFVQIAFPYPLTGAQNRAIADIRRDVKHPIPMNRLVQGDVGSGKTAVAITAMAMALANGKQAAIMSPTSILAEQHYRNMETIFNRFEDNPHLRRPVVALLTSALTTSERQAVYRGMADGSIDVVVGTHALIMPGVEFKDLAVAVIDEQHRFGVEQRGRLRGKGTNPHMLVMTATPIPRTLALTLYADLDLSIIDEKPAGRQPIQTRLLIPSQREIAFRFVGAQLEQGRQAFIVHPLVEDSENLDVRSAVTAYEELQQIFYKQRICLLHGRMKPAEKDDIMGAFARHEYDVMVTTSVAEVGVDVPNASVILIEGANRFGLAQLHQFRGRVGRGEHPSFCLLIPDSDTSEAEDRLQVMVDTDDGFVLAERDWKLRGAGDLLGTRQSGAMVMKLAEHITPELVTLAQREARTLYEEDPLLELEKHALLRAAVQQLFNPDGDVS